MLGGRLYGRDTNLRESKGMTETEMKIKEKQRDEEREW